MIISGAYSRPARLSNLAEKCPSRRFLLASRAVKRNIAIQSNFGVARQAEGTTSDAAPSTGQTIGTTQLGYGILRHQETKLTTSSCVKQIP